MTTISRSAPAALKILIVKDDKTDPNLAKSLLQEAGYEVIDARGVDRALTALAEHQPHLILIDMELAHVNGQKLARQLKQRSRITDISIIALTADLNQSVRGQARNSEFAACLVKPINPLTFVQEVVSVVTRGRRKRPTTTILIADDIETNRTLLRAMLESEGYPVVEASDGQEALVALQLTEAPIVALIDWRMPRMEGIEVCRRVRLRPDPPPMYLIILTARGSQQEIVAGLQSGANDYITKPFLMGELLARVKIGTQMVELQHALANRVRDLQEALAQVKQLSGILPICSYCKKIRDDRDYWQRVEEFISAHSEAQFSHSICPDCYSSRVRPELERMAAAASTGTGTPGQNEGGGPAPL